MKQFMLTLSFLLCYFAWAGAMAQQFPSGIDRVEIAVSSNWDTIAANVGKAFGEALRVDGDVHIMDIDSRQFWQLLGTADDPQLGTLRIFIAGVATGHPLPFYSEDLDLVGVVAEKPIAIFEATSGRLEQQTQYLAFAMQNLDNPRGVAKVLEHAAANKQYKQILEELGLRGFYIGADTYRDTVRAVRREFYIGADTYRDTVRAVRSGRCDFCICDDEICRSSCDKCKGWQITQ